MNNLLKLLSIGVVLILMSSKCKDLKPDSFITSSIKYETAGGAYGSGNSLVYQFIFAESITDSFIIDSAFFEAGANQCYRKLKSDKGIQYIKLDDGSFQLNCKYMFGEIRQPNDEVKNISIPKYPKPARMKENQCLLVGKYQGKNYELLIPIVKKRATIHHE